MKRFEAVFDSLEVIEERIREKLTVEKLAGSVHFSKYHYQRLFREAVGESVMQYVARRRMALAAQELAGTDASVLEIALKYGYDSHEGFTRSFRAHMGVTPAEYRKYHCSIGFPQTQKERGAIMYARNTDEIIKELNQLIVQARETVDFTAKNRNIPDAAAYTEFWTYTAQRTEAAADALADPALPYGYIADAVRDIADELSSLPLREVTVTHLEDCGIRLDIIASAAALDGWRAPEHRDLFDSIGDFHSRIDEAIAFFQNLPEDVSRIAAETENGGMERNAAKKYSDMAFQGNILLFYLKGETQKLECHLKPKQRAALEEICDRLAGVIGRVAHRAEEETADRIIESLQGIYRDMAALAEELGQHGTSIHFIAEQIDNIRSM